MDPRLHAHRADRGFDARDAETYIKLTDTLEGLLGRLADDLDQLGLDQQQRILPLVVREVLIGEDDDKLTIRHSIPTPIGPVDPSYLLRGTSHHPALRRYAPLVTFGRKPTMQGPQGQRI